MGGDAVKETVSTCAAVAAGLVSWLVGGFDVPIAALVVCMGVDYITGLIVAGVFHSSPKTAGGGLDSRVGWKGLARKVVTILIVLVANLMDLVLGGQYIRDAAVIGFCANECISVLENAGLMGLDVPKNIADAVEQLNQKEENHDRA